MKSTGIVRKVDPLGRIVLPKELRKILGIDSKTPLEIFKSEDTVVLRRYEPLCFICGSSDDLKDFNTKRICRGCIEECKKA